METHDCEEEGHLEEVDLVMLVVVEMVEELTLVEKQELDLMVVEEENNFLKVLWEL